VNRPTDDSQIAAGRRDLVLGIDLGTSYFKLGLFDRQGELRGMGRIFVAKDRGDGSRCEVPVDRFWALLCRGMSEACRQASASPEQICGLSYASQANSFLLLDRDMAPLTPLILWADDRAAETDSLATLFKRSDFLPNTGIGIPPSHQFCLAKVDWLKRHQPALFARAVYLMTISDYLSWALTGELVGDAGTASLLGLLDQRTLTWRREMIDLGDLSLSMPLQPGTPAGKLSRNGAALLGLKPGVPFAVGNLDHPAAALGAGAGQIADLSESTGTVLACVRFVADYSPRPGSCTGAGFEPGEHYQLAFDDNGAAGVEWYQQNHATELTIPQLEKLAAKVPAGSEGLLARPAAHRWPDLTGFLPTDKRHQHGHFTRALFESTAASLAILVASVCGGQRPKRIVATGGGAQSDLWLQIKADLLGIEWITTETIDPACLGAAILAAVAAGWVADCQTAASKWIRVRKTYQPNMAQHRLYEEWIRTRDMEK